MIKFNSIKIKFLLFEFILIILLFLAFSFVAYRFISSDKSDQLRTGLASSNQNGKKRLENFFTETQTTNSFIENFLNQYGIDKKQSPFLSQFGQLQKVQIGEEVFYQKDPKSIFENMGNFEINNKLKIINIEKELTSGEKISFTHSTDFIHEFFNTKINKNTAELLLKDSQVLFTNFGKDIEPQIQNNILLESKNLNNSVVKEFDYKQSKNFISCSFLENKAFKYCSFSNSALLTNPINFLLFDYFLLFLSILSFTGIIVLLLLKKFTSPLEILKNAALDFSKGNFKVRTAVTTNDEIGELSTSFNYMAEEIETYIDKVKDKARMEGELEVANFVQSCFFPLKHSVSFSNLEAYGFLQAASECSGDWWGIKALDQKLVLFLGDATGHGVGSALITSAVFSTVNLLEQNFFKDGLNASEIMNVLNKSVNSLGGEILMTFFIAVIDPKKQTLEYCNASHNPPFLVSKDQTTKFLNESFGKRLGQEKETQYQNHTLELKKEDVLMIYTDGISEAENSKGRQYGEKRVLKKLKTVLELGPQEIVEYFLDDAREFCGSNTFEDDLTLLALKVN
jgi:serine phosphatase RsbU (regulator of sigma subunit)